MLANLAANADIAAGATLIVCVIFGALEVFKLIDKRYPDDRYRF